MKLFFKLCLLFFATDVICSQRRINNPYAVSDEFRQELEGARQAREFQNHQVEECDFLLEKLEREKQEFRDKIEPLLLSYHKKPSNIYSGRIKKTFEKACQIISSTSSAVLNSDCSIGDFSFQRRVALLGDRELIQHLINCGFNPDKSYGPHDSLRENLEYLYSLFFKQDPNEINVKAAFFKNCLDVLPANINFQERLEDLLLELHKNYTENIDERTKQRAERYVEVERLLQLASSGVLNDTKIKGKDIALHLGVMGDPFLLQMFLNYRLDSDKVFFDMQLGKCRLEDFFYRKIALCHDEKSRYRYKKCLKIVLAHKQMKQQFRNSL